MKKLLLVVAVMATAHLGFSQMSFTVNNEADETITVGVQVSNQVSGDCVPVGSYGSTLLDTGTDTYDFTGSEYPHRIGVSGTSGSGFVFYNGSCGTDVPGPYFFVWTSWNELTIF